MVIDYDKPLDEEGNQYETYFLNLVDVADLAALTEDGDKEAVCTCADKCVVGSIDTSCPVCAANMASLRSSLPTGSRPSACVLFCCIFRSPYIDFLKISL